MKVVAGILIRNGKVLIARRAGHKSMAGKWEFPGGKVEDGESCELALERELLEEFGVKVRVGDFLGSHRHDYDTFTIDLHAYYATYVHGEFALTDHDQIAWVTKEELPGFDMAGADIPFIDQIDI